MSTPAFHAAMNAAKATIDQVKHAPAKPWGWVGNHGAYIVRHGQEEVAMLTIIPDTIRYEAALMDNLVDLFRNAQPD